MSKITIFEDSERAIERRYGRLLNDHDLKLYFVEGLDGVLSPRNEQELTEAGVEVVRLREQQLKEGDFLADMSADFYFVDGLSGRCWQVMEKLPREKAWLISNNPTLCRDAKERGYNAVNQYCMSLDEEVERIVREGK